MDYLIVGAGFAGATCADIWRSLLALGIVTVVGIPTSLLTLHFVIEKGRREGTLVEY